MIRPKETRQNSTPAVAAGVADHIWTVPELIENAAQSLPEPEMGL
jgi:hypothetical protein